ncbi:MAG: protein kinase [Planctomycetes bacterium]|nr:protein kinase [Planctomycetota bacterium]
MMNGEKALPKRDQDGKAMENTPNLIGGNRIVEKLGAGGMGAVYLAKHQTLGREVALKLLPPEFTQHKEYVERFLREARAAAQLKHPNVVQVYDAGEQGGQFYISMEFVKGKSLGHLQREKGPLDEAVALRFLQQAAHGLAAAHALGLVHRDIKPENLLVDTDGTVKVADFGLVSDVEGDSGLTQPGAMLGTPTYMSPEQCDGLKADVRSDLYSLGAAFYRLMTGSAPFTAPTPIGVLYKHRYEPTPDPRTVRPQISEATAQMLLRMMAKRPEDRFQTAAEVAAFADAVLKGGEATLRPGAMNAGAPMHSPVGMPVATPTPGAMPMNTPMPTPVPGSALTPMPATLLPNTLVGSPTPTPGMPYGATPYAMPAPVAPPKPRSKAALALVAILFLALAGIGGFFGWQKYNEMQIAEAKTQAGQARALKQYDGALAVLDAAIARYPEEASLKTLRDQIDVDFVRAQVEAFKTAAETAQKASQWSEAVAAYGNALALEAQRKDLNGLTADPLLPNLKKHAEDLRDFHDYMAQGRQAEDSAEFAKAAELYEKAATFEAATGTEARNAATKAHFQDLLAQAKALEKDNKLAEALEKVNAAADLNVRSLKEDQSRLGTRIRYDGLLADADNLKSKGNLREAAEMLKRAAGLLPQDSKADDLLADSQNLIRDAEFNEAMAAGDAALGKSDWAAAKTAFTKAGELKKDQSEPGRRYKHAQAGETASEGAALLAQKKWADAKAKYLEAAKLHPEQAAYAAKAAEIAAQEQGIAGLEDAARAADTAQDFKKASDLWTRLESEDPENKTTYRQRANSAAYNDLDQQANDLIRAGKLTEALAVAERSKGFDSATNGERSAARIKEIEGKIAARQAAQATGEALANARSLVEQGHAAEAVLTLRGAVQQNPQNAQLARELAGAEGVEAVERGYKRLEEIRSDAEASAKTSVDADDDKKIAAHFQAIQDWQGKLEGSRGAARQAWLDGKFELIAQAADTMKAQGREMGNEFTSIAAFFSGKAADAAQAKANVGGAVGGLLGGRGRGFGSVGANTDVGRNNKKAAIFQATANALTAAGNEARRIGASQ